MGDKLALALLFYLGIIYPTCSQVLTLQEIAKNFGNKTQQILHQYDTDTLQLHSDMQDIFKTPQQSSYPQTSIAQYPVQNKIRSPFIPYQQQPYNAPQMHIFQGAPQSLIYQGAPQVLTYQPAQHITLPYVTQDNIPQSQIQGPLTYQDQNNIQNFVQDISQKHPQNYVPSQNLPQNYVQDISQNQPQNNVQDISQNRPQNYVPDVSQNHPQNYMPGISQNHPQNYVPDVSQNQQFNSLQDQENELHPQLSFQTQIKQQNIQKQSKDLAEYFHQCHYLSTEFDSCIKDALNQLNHLFPTGVPEYDIPSFDPFFASEVETMEKTSLLSTKIKLTNVYESGWAMSTVTGFKSDLQNNRVTIDQTWPDKRLAGGYEFQVKLFGQVVLKNKGYFNLTLLGFNQTTQLTRPTGEYDDQNQPLVRCNVEIQGVRDLRLHITNLLFGARHIEYVLDGIINATWRPFYPLTKPLVNELVSKAFTKIFTRAFRKVPFEYFFVA